MRPAAKIRHRRTGVGQCGDCARDRAPGMRIEDVLNGGPTSRSRPGTLAEPTRCANKRHTGAGQRCKKVAAIQHWMSVCGDPTLVSFGALRQCARAGSYGPRAAGLTGAKVLPDFETVQGSSNDGSVTTDSEDASRHDVHLQVARA